MTQRSQQIGQAEFSASTESSGSVGGWGIIEVLIKNRRAVIWYPLAVAVIVALFSLVVPEQYVGEVSVLPPDRNFQTITLRNFSIGDLGMGGGMSLPFMATPSDILAEVLQSRRVLAAVVDSLRLDSLWQLPSKHAAINRLRQAISVRVELTGLVNVRVVDRSPRRAAQTVDVLVTCADGINRAIVNIRARNTREFIGRRLVETQHALTEAAADLESFQREHRTVSLDDELAVSIQSAATLDAQLTADEIELSVLKKNMSSQNPRVAALEQRIVATRHRLVQMEIGGDTSRIFLSAGLRNVPRLALDLAEKIRRVKIEETLLELLTSQYESAKIQEAQDTPTISVLDYADPSGPRSRPRRARLVPASYVASLVMIIALSFAGEYFAVMRRREPGKYERLMAALAVLRRDGLGLRRRN